MDGTNKGFWQRMARLYTPFMKSDAALYQAIEGYCAQRLAPGAELLELATGPGILALALAQTGARITATDYAEKMIAQAKKQPCPENVRFAVADATALEYEDESFDVVLIANALHIMPRPEAALAEIRRVLRPGGILIAPTFVHGEGTSLRLRARVMEAVGLHTYHKWTGEELAAFVERGGFVVEKRQVLRGKTMPLCYIEARRG